MFKASRFATLFAVVAMGIASFAAAPSASAEEAEEMGSTCSDCATYDGKYSVKNTAMFTITYQYRWGKDHEWKTKHIKSGHRITHSKFLGYDSEERIARPYLRFMKRNGNWSQAFKLKFYAVTDSPGYGGKKHGRPYRYELNFTGDFQEIGFVDSDDDES